jgi:small subunit ribosomal protein S6
MARPLPKYRAREYETIFILHPDSTSAAVEKIADRCIEVIDRLDGKLLRAENWGRRRLAYPVKKNRKGIYVYVRYLGYQDMVHELERNLRMLDPVVKYLTVKVDEDVDPSARPVREEDISFLPRYEEDEHVEAVGAAAETRSTQTAVAEGEQLEDAEDEQDDADRADETAIADADHAEPGDAEPPAEDEE